MGGGSSLGGIIGGVSGALTGGLFDMGKSARDARKAQEAAAAKAEAAAKAAQQQQQQLAAEEAAAADLKLEEQRARILKGKQGRGGLLFGGELGVSGDDTTKAKTLGA